jgi:hypothetical protein
MSTVITWLPTPEGFVIASDGRRSSSENDEILSDDVQKLFPVEQSNVRLAYGLAGTIQMGPTADNVLFDFAIETARAVERLATSKRNWWQYITALMSELARTLNLLRTSRDTLAKPTNTWIFIGGFCGRHLKSGYISFEHGASVTEGKTFNNPAGFIPPPFGSPKVFDLIDAEDDRFLRYAKPRRNSVVTLSSAIERARNDVLAHYDREALKVDPDTCRTIGGRVQIATVTYSEGFRWVPGFESASGTASSQ